MAARFGFQLDAKHGIEHGIIAATGFERSEATRPE
jgi:hypothetical protein